MVAAFRQGGMSGEMGTDGVRAKVWQAGDSPRLHIRPEGKVYLAMDA